MAFPKTTSVFMAEPPTEEKPPAKPHHFVLATVFSLSVVAIIGWTVMQPTESGFGFARTFLDAVRGRDFGKAYALVNDQWKRDEPFFQAEQQMRDIMTKVGNFQKLHLKEVHFQRLNPVSLWTRQVYSGQSDAGNIGVTVELLWRFGRWQATGLEIKAEKGGYYRRRFFSPPPQA
jgi:hypothetical protein